MIKFLEVKSENGSARYIPIDNIGEITSIGENQSVIQLKQIAEIWRETIVFVNMPANELIHMINVYQPGENGIISV